MLTLSDNRVLKLSSFLLFICQEVYLHAADTSFQTPLCSRAAPRVSAPASQFLEPHYGSICYVLLALRYTSCADTRTCSCTNQLTL
jgi:hypothetical protein